MYVNDLIGLFAQSNSSKIETAEVKQYLEWTTDMSQSSLRVEIGDFTLSPERLNAITELTWQNIEVLRELTASMKN